MSREEQKPRIDRSKAEDLSGEPPGEPRERDGELLPTIALIHVPHPQIPNLFQCCYEYVEPWQWSAGAEMVETGRWFYGAAKAEQ